MAHASLGWCAVRNELLEEYLRVNRPRGERHLPHGFYDRRDQLRARTSFAIPTDEALLLLARQAPLIELGAGTGYWAALLRARGVDILAYDRAPADGGENNHWHSGHPPFSEVRRGGVEVLAQHPGRSLFLCWPPYRSPMAYQALRAYAGQTLIYIGEGEHGCTATPGFFRLLVRDWKQVASLSLPNWPGIHDRLSVWRRQAPVP